MYTIRTLNNIAKTGLAKLPEQDFVIDEKAENPEGIILRSFDMHKMELNENLLAVARAGAGTNNIPIEKCTQKGVPVFNTPGANANAVKELVLAGLFASSRRIIAGAAWVQGLKDNCENVEKAVEAGKKEFTGPEIAGKTLGVIGLGAIGVQVANAALDLGMEVIGYDPFLSLESAWHLSPNVVHEESMEELVAKADYITLHIPLNDKTRNTFDEKLFAATKPGARLLNFARGGLVDNAALKKAIADGIIARYMTDFPSEDLLGDPANIIVTPHLGASTPESEENCAIMAAQEIREYLTYGNIKNSVNMPTVAMAKSGSVRVTVIHKNQPNMIAFITDTISKDGVNIASFEDKNRGAIAYSIIDCDTDVSTSVVSDIEKIDGVIKVRVIK